MADQEAAAKQRIVSHMNEDHHDSIVRYLQYYKSISMWNATKGKMTDCTLNSMSFLCGGIQHQIPFDPPLKSLRETRERVVAMDKECRDALGVSDITINEYVPPTGLYAVEFAIVASVFLAYSQRWWFAKGRFVHSLLGEGFARFSWTIQPWLIAFMVLLHAAETSYFIRNKLMQHSVSPRSFAFWQWVGGTFVEGVFSMMRFNHLVRQKRAEKDKQKH